MFARVNRTLARARSGEEDGMALLSVLGVLIILTAFLLATLAFTLQNMRPSRADADSRAAVAAAQAGIDDYVSRLNASPGYWRNLNTDTTNTALRNGATGTNPSWSTWGRTVPATSGAGASYRYEVLSSSAQVAALGVVRLRSTGISRGVTRTLTASLQPTSFLQFIYHTDKENLDPALYTTNTSVATRCAQYWWAGRDSVSGCTEISFGGGDIINGPMHTNDTIAIGAGGVTFTNQQVETSWNCPNTSQCYRKSSTASDAVPRQNSPYYAPIVQIPTSNDSLKAIAATDEGCVYTGATQITFTGTTMTVLSPNTTSAPSRCYNTSASDKSQPQTGLEIPSVIYVDELAGNCARRNGNPIGLGYPLSGEYVGNGTSTFSGDYVGPVYGCANGNAYVKGTLDGATTVASSEDIVMVGDLKYRDASSSSTNALGLIPGHFAWVYHPIAQCSNNTYDRTTGKTCRNGYMNMLDTPVTTIQAAILAVKDSFIVQSYTQAPQISSGTTNRLNVFGAISQNYRGPVALSGATGYVKNYVYDSRFQRGVQPPYFLQPVSAQWRAIDVSDG